VSHVATNGAGAVSRFRTGTGGAPARTCQVIQVGQFGLWRNRRLNDIIQQAPIGRRTGEAVGRRSRGGLPVSHLSVTARRGGWEFLSLLMLSVAATSFTAWPIAAAPRWARPAIRLLDFREGDSDLEGESSSIRLRVTGPEVYSRHSRWPQRARKGPGNPPADHGGLDLVRPPEGFRTGPPAKTRPFITTPLKTILVRRGRWRR